MNKKPIRVLLVDDSPVALTIFKRLLGGTPDIEIVGTARTGVEGLTLVPQVQPDVICTDLHMPEMNGLEFTQEVMSKFPRPILAISSSVQAEDTHNVFKLLKAGAVDVFPKPRSGMMNNFDRLRQELIGKIRVLSGVAVFTLHRRSAASGEVSVVRPQPRVSAPPPRSLPPVCASPKPEKSVRVSGEDAPRKRSFLGSDRPSSVMSRSVPPPATPASAAFYRMVAIGASTGGPQALYGILTQLPPNFPVPVLCVQHISEGFLQGLVDWLALECHLPVKIAPPGEYPQPGMVYFPPERKHLELDNRGRFVHSNAPPYSGHRPSVTVMFESVAHYYGRGVLGVLLTGMGRDGAEGMQAIARAGGLTIAQNEATCVVFGMPREAIALGAAHYILPVTDIAPMLIRKVVSSRSG
ncbi:chemotaxis-specific protein-glutamate methyltransferase CheB [Phormidium sp. CCY1219]|uniref:chemotaxis-specific protein-glutamate methyltransferase CheB n=1 Tax=Phormidium sp. CCY1219 TaxID=2886104 RepID=UPI002D1E9BD2|nr:chemotaxis-specific protein-glutamate methyltransferase CheB [Phormidium sp. CCY1219]MEB3827074.1 chemotaxis-specific protein-glutamate methyltransferase CheB [Phormidium sp. CCY1219]